MPQPIEDALAGPAPGALVALRELPRDAWDDALAALALRHGRTWHSKGGFREQRELCELILAHLPQQWEALHLLGFHAQTAGEFARAADYYTRALNSNPQAAFSRLALAQMRMLRSGFTEGRDLYEARFDAVTEGSGADWRGLPIPRWRGESLTGKALYLWAEQGLGDMVMFAGFLPYILGQKPRRVALGCQPKVAGIFARAFPDVHVEPLDDAALHALGPTVLTAFPQIEKLAAHSPVPIPLEPLRAAYDYVTRHGLFDYAAPMGDLLVQCMPQVIPAQRQKRYLRADAGRVAALQEQLAGMGEGRRIGISWFTTNRSEAARNIPLDAWLGVLAMPGCHFVSLQHHAKADEIAMFCKVHGCRISVLEELDFTGDADGLLALIAAMDEVITIDNSNAHIAGALGVPTTLLLPVGCNYRWPPLPHDATLWYASVHTLRQKMLFEWGGVMEELRKRMGQEQES
jgi:tetratricopeptide (TPR) repeat protein